MKYGPIEIDLKPNPDILLSPKDQEKLAVVLSRCTLDKAFRKRFMENPAEIFAEIGIKLAPKYTRIMATEIPEDTFFVPVPHLLPRAI